MEKITLKRFINTPIIILIAGIVFEIVSLLIYRATGVNEFNDSLSPNCLLFSILTIGLGLVLLILRFLAIDTFKLFNGLFDVFVVINYLLALLAFMFYIISEVNYLANVFVSIDGTKISPSFVLTTGSFLISFVLILISAIQSKKLFKKVDKGENHENETI